MNAEFEKWHRRAAAKLVNLSRKDVARLAYEAGARVRKRKQKAREFKPTSDAFFKYYGPHE